MDKLCDYLKSIYDHDCVYESIKWFFFFCSRSLNLYSSTGLTIAVKVVQIKNV